MINDVKENEFINSLASGFAQSSLKLNKIHECDSEILRISEDTVIAVTTDSISEEIKSGLYDDPYLAGWMIVTVNMSDLAACGAEPAGILLSEIIPDNFGKVELEKLQRGISDACKKHSTFLLGGDINSGDSLILTGTALGICTGKKYLTRTGISQGDILYTSGFLGAGNAFALSKFHNKGVEKFRYLPAARLKESRIIKKYASACMDTSDGAIAVLDQLMRLNNLGFELHNIRNIIAPESVKAAELHGIPLWLLLAGIHGEFELLFTLPPESERDFLNECNSIGWNPLNFGNVISEAVVKADLYGGFKIIDSFKIRNLAFNLSKNLNKYIQSLINVDLELKR